MMKLQNTPWGPPQHEREIAPGIIEVSTASHGGIWLSPERRHELPFPLSAIKPWAGAGWYEEDCDVCLVWLAFPELFDGRALHGAVEFMTGRGKPKHWGTVEQYLDTPKGQVAARKAREWFMAHAHLFEFGCQCGGRGGCSGELVRVDRKERYCYECAEWPSISGVFTLAAARAAGLKVMEIESEVAV